MQSRENNINQLLGKLAEVSTYFESLRKKSQHGLGVSDYLNLRSAYLMLLAKKLNIPSSRAIAQPPSDPHYAHLIENLDKSLEKLGSNPALQPEVKARLLNAYFILNFQANVDVGIEYLLEPEANHYERGKDFNRFKSLSDTLKHYCLASLKYFEGYDTEARLAYLKKYIADACQLVLRRGRLIKNQSACDAVSEMVWQLAKPFCQTLLALPIEQLENKQKMQAVVLREGSANADPRSRFSAIIRQYILDNVAKSRKKTGLRRATELLKALEDDQGFEVVAAFIKTGKASQGDMQPASDIFDPDSLRGRLFDACFNSFGKGANVSGSSAYKARVVAVREFESALGRAKASARNDRTQNRAQLDMIRTRYLKVPVRETGLEGAMKEMLTASEDTLNLQKKNVVNALKNLMQQQPKDSDQDAQFNIQSRNMKILTTAIDRACANLQKLGVIKNKRAREEISHEVFNMAWLDNEKEAALEAAIANILKPEGSQQLIEFMKPYASGPLIEKLIQGACMRLQQSGKIKSTSLREAIEALSNKIVQCQHLNSLPLNKAITLLQKFISQHVSDAKQLTQAKNLLNSLISNGNEKQAYGAYEAVGKLLASEDAFDLQSLRGQLFDAFVLPEMPNSQKFIVRENAMKNFIKDMAAAKHSTKNKSAQLQAQTNTAILKYVHPDQHETTIQNILRSHYLDIANKQFYVNKIVGGLKNLEVCDEIFARIEERGILKNDVAKLALHTLLETINEQQNVYNAAPTPEQVFIQKCLSTLHQYIIDNLQHTSKKSGLKRAVDLLNDLNKNSANPYNAVCVFLASGDTNSSREFYHGRSKLSDANSLRGRLFDALIMKSGDDREKKVKAFEGELSKAKPGVWGIPFFEKMRISEQASIIKNEYITPANKGMAHKPKR